jgi:hypothetical protein
MEIDKITLIATALLIVSEGLASIPAIRANSIFQLIVNIIKTVAGKK